MIKLNNIFLILFSILINVEISYSQVNQQWTERYSGTPNGIDGASEMITDTNGYIYITGASYGISNNYDYLTIKYSPSGILKWTARYNGQGNGPDIVNSMAVDESGNVYITGGSDGAGSGTDYTTIKYDSSGVQQWVARYTTSGNHRDAAYALAIDHSGNVFVTGESYNISTIDYLTIKYNSSGVQQWVRRYIDGIAYSIAVDDSNNVVVTGRGAGDFATVKYNSSGLQKWVSRFNGPLNGDDEANSIGIDSLGNAYVCGSTEGALFYSDYATVKYNSAGIEQWYRVYKGSANFLDLPKAIKVDRTGNSFVTGYSTESGRGYDMTTIKYSTNGDTLWKASYHNGLNDIAFALALDNYGNVYVTGESDGSGSSDDYSTVKYNSLGQQQWVKKYDYSGQFGDVAQAIAVDKNGNVYVTGSSDRDYLTIKYSQLTGASTVFTEIPREFSLSQNYPNPFNPVTNFGFGISKFPKGQVGFVSLKVFNVMGEEITPLVNENKSPGIYEVEFDGSRYPSGIYFYRLEIDGNTIDTKRMILLK